MSLFDTVIMVDWSAAKTPARGKDSVWWALHRREGGYQFAANPTTRAEAVEVLAYVLAAEVDLGHRVLVGFDFPVGYPAGFAERLTCQARAFAVWDWLSARITDGPKNANNRFVIAAGINAALPGPGPFWGRPRSEDLPDLPERQEGIRYEAFAEKRLAERRCPGAQPVWKLYTTGSVGGQVLVGLPALNRLRQRLKGRLAVWPFDTGLSPGSRPVVLAEVYPSLLAAEVDAGCRPGEVKDAAQVRILAAALAALDEQGGLAPLFAPDLTANERRQVVQEEAWILGVGHEDALRGAAHAV